MIFQCSATAHDGRRGSIAAHIRHCYIRSQSDSKSTFKTKRAKPVSFQGTFAMRTFDPVASKEGRQESFRIMYNKVRVYQGKRLGGECELGELRASKLNASGIGKRKPVVVNTPLLAPVWNDRNTFLHLGKST